MTIDKPTLPSGNRRRKALLGATLAFLLIGVAAVLYYMLVLSQEEETDNAYIGGNLVMLTSQVTGNVQEIRADETQLVNAGAEVIKLDAVDADVTLRQAQARLGAIVLQLREKYANAVQYEAVLQQRKLSLKKAEDDLARRAPLGDDHTLSAEEVTHAKQAVDDAKAALNVAVEQVKTAQAALGGTTLAQHPAVLAAKEDFVQAWLAARRNAILAPVSGYVAKRSVQVGAHVSPGMALLSIVPLDQLWVDANFKESELQNIRIGQPVTVEADIYGGKVTYHGNVVGLSAGTGSAFSLLPAQNASGNWIKVVQRLPVRIALDSKELAEHPLRVGLSATVTVDTHRRDGAVLGAAMPSVPVYATQSLGQLVQDADKMADTVIAKNIAK
ncbi:HlyD family efflux transporter periplasmic adaptor subunit [Propionivibrio sp.]|jgi:membrane fusion protein (multidrug efflux system)|uniref:HlyD family secretion protein n=2 Tax=Betaproteobacteria TaxID=28216 RepID=UPI001B5E741B|nr:HlyD family efflux transporter periplasmic adaptor subunit [Propionivibrio sp.]MBP8275801.1 HlyD family efflux transporter periplasmic adaptor subunit [Propionivibrio sp.]